MLEKIKTIVIDYVKSLGDIRVLGQSVFVVIVLLTSWSGIKAIQTNYELQKKIVRLEQQVEIAELENQNLQLSNKYLETDQFLELSVRRQFGKAAPGEKIYIVPKDVALKYAPILASNDKEIEKQTDKPWYQQNLEAWMNFFFRESNNKLLEA
jgi:cell division protein FtsB